MTAPALEVGNFRGACRVSRIAGWLESLASLIYPRVCAVCATHEAGPETGYVCQPCRSSSLHVRPVCPPYCGRCGLPYAGEITGEFVCANCRDLPLQFAWARAAVAATPFLLEVVHRYKYGRDLWFETFLAELLVSAAAPELRGQGWDALVPVPLHPVRQREREFNQAERLARHLGRATGIPVARDWVRRAHPTRTQTLLDRAARSKNVARAFSARSDAPVQGARVVVVDDVLTTGATTSAVSAALLEAGAREVAVWTLARGV